MFEQFILLGHIISSTCKWNRNTGKCPDIKSSHWNSFGPENDCLLLVSFISVKACASRKTPQRTHAATHAHRALFYCLAHCGYIRHMQKKRKKKSTLLICLLWCWLITRNWNYFAFAFVVLLFICVFFLINPEDFFWCLLLFLLLHFHPLNFVSTSPLTITPLLSIVSSLSSPAMHLGIPQDMESDPDDEVKQILHHHMELLLLCRPFCWLYCRCCSKYFVSVQYLGVTDAARVFLLHSSDPFCSAWVEIAAVLISKDLFIVVFIPSPVEPVAVPCLSLFFISIFLSIHVQQGVTMSPSLLLTHRKSHTGLRYLLSAEDETLTLIICLLSHCFVVFGVPLLHPCPWLVFNRRILTLSAACHNKV